MCLCASSDSDCWLTFNTESFHLTTTRCFNIHDFFILLSSVHPFRADRFNVLGDKTSQPNCLAQTTTSLNIVIIQFCLTVRLVDCPYYTITLLPFAVQS